MTQTNDSNQSFIACPLCHSRSYFFCQDKKRSYYSCETCALIAADPASHLSESEEKALYDLHENDPNDVRYREFLNQLAQPLMSKLHAGMNGLDYGAGPGPLLSQVINDAGMNTLNYDPFYANEPSLLNHQYDFVTCSEVVEHFNQPESDWRNLVKLVKPEGWLGIMTWMLENQTPDKFLQWSYKGDPTHVSFYQPETFAWLGQQYGFEIEIINYRVILMRKL